MSWISDALDAITPDLNNPKSMAQFGALGNMLVEGSKQQTGTMSQGSALLGLIGAGYQGFNAGAQAGQEYQTRDIANQQAQQINPLAVQQQQQLLQKEHANMPLDIQAKQQGNELSNYDLMYFRKMNGLDANTGLPLNIPQQQAPFGFTAPSPQQPLPIWQPAPPPSQSQGGQLPPNVAAPMPVPPIPATSPDFVSSSFNPSQQRIQDAIASTPAGKSLGATSPSSLQINAMPTGMRSGQPITSPAQMKAQLAIMPHQMKMLEQGKQQNPDGSISNVLGSEQAASDMAASTKQGEALGAANIEVQKQINDDASSAVKAKRTISEMEKLAQNFTPGKMASIQKGIAEYKQGIDPDGKLGIYTDSDAKLAASTQGIDKLTAQLATQALKEFTSRGTQMEFKTFLANNPNIAMTKEGFDTLIGFMKKTSNLALDRQSYFMNWKNGKIDGEKHSPKDYQDFDAAWTQYENKNMGNSLQDVVLNNKSKATHMWTPEKGIQPNGGL
jgi:hypothetical protein